MRFREKGLSINNYNNNMGQVKQYPNDLTLQAKPNRRLVIRSGFFGAGV